MTGAQVTSRSADYDVVIVGGGPAGSAAAVAAARRNLSTLIIERGAARQPGACAGWLGPAAIRQCEECGVDLAAAAGVEFSGLRLWPWDLTNRVEVDDPEVSGWIVAPSALSHALLGTACASGAHVLHPATVTQLQLGESYATVHLSDGRTVTGQIVLIADGAASATAQAAHLATLPHAGSVSAGAQVVLETTQAGSGLDVIVGAARALKLATIARHRTQIRVAMLTRDHSLPATAQLAALLEAGKAAGVLPRDCNAAPVETPCLAGVALEIESHVGKRCLLVGEAGGFVTSFSNEGIYPALRSGWLAAETAARALPAAVLQDELASFSSDWRADLADYLRMPNTDLGLLLPMVFGNPQMSRRLARAFLLGGPF